jgi:hypothetical protein
MAMMLLSRALDGLELPQETKDIIRAAIDEKERVGQKRE